MKDKRFQLLAGIGMCLLMPTVAKAEVLIILPEQGAMAVAASSVRDGIEAAYYAGKQQPPLRFVDNSQRSIADVLATELRANTELVIGPLARGEVAELLATKPKVKVLALNQIVQNDANVWQFALSPDEDARAMTHRMQQDGVDEILMLTQNSKRRSTDRFSDAMARLWGAKLKVVYSVPNKITAQQGVLLLGDYAWINRLKNLPKTKLYTVPLAIQENPRLPVGLTVCDTPALYQAGWPELLRAYQKKPVNMAYQRLLAFGADAWQISTVILNGQPRADFAGRTGHIHIVKNMIERQPMCMTAGIGQFDFHTYD